MAKSLDDQFSRVISDYARMTHEQVKAAVNKTSEEVRDKTKSRSPVRAGKHGGKYAKSWKIKDGTKTQQRDSRFVYNSPEYRLTHLLQHGHGGPRGPAKAIPHIVQDDEAEDMLVKNIEEEMQ